MQGNLAYFSLIAATKVFIYMQPRVSQHFVLEINAVLNATLGYKLEAWKTYCFCSNPNHLSVDQRPGLFSRHKIAKICPSF